MNGIGVSRGGRLLVAVLVVSTAALAACSNGPAKASGGDAARPGTIRADLKDFAIALARTSAAAGRVTFDIRNDGPSVHEFVVATASVPAGQLTVDSGEGTVDESGGGFAVVDEAEDIDPKTATTLSLTLKPGTYAIICNLVGHYQQGMWASFTVT